MAPVFSSLCLTVTVLNTVDVLVDSYTIYVAPFVKGAVALCLARLDKGIYLVYEVKAKKERQYM